MKCKEKLFCGGKIPPQADVETVAAVSPENTFFYPAFDSCYFKTVPWNSFLALLAGLHPN
jgi:hypothetical protein